MKHPDARYPDEIAAGIESAKNEGGSGASPCSPTLRERENYACKCCGNIPDEEGIIEHGKGCYTQSEDGGGMSFVEFVENEKEQESK